jgi:DNA-binding MarR family transcriptional regulator
MDKPLTNREKLAASASAGEAAARPIVLGPLDGRLGYALRRAQLAVFHDFFNAFAQLDIRPAQYSVLTIIEHNPGLPQGRVADALGIQKTNFVSMIGTLERRGLVRREASTQDRRTYGLYLTGEGTKLMVKLHHTAQDHEDRIIERIGRAAYDAVFSPLRRLAED